jgi:hypothetical protein
MKENRFFEAYTPTPRAHVFIMDGTAESSGCCVSEADDCDSTQPRPNDLRIAGDDMSKVPGTKIMKIFLQDCKTAKFMRCDSMWTTDINEALSFYSVQGAIFFGMKELGDSFQILQMESVGFSAPITTIIAQPQWPKIEVLFAQPTKFQKQILPQNFHSRPSNDSSRILPQTTSKFFRATTW